LNEQLLMMSANPGKRSLIGAPHLLGCQNRNHPFSVLGYNAATTAIATVSV
jgi:hypothetical protein